MFVKSVGVTCFIKDGKKSFYIPIKKNIKEGEEFKALKNYLPIDLSLNDEIIKSNLFEEINNNIKGDSKEFKNVFFHDCEFVFSLNNNSEIKAFIIFDTFFVEALKDDNFKNVKKAEIKAKEVNEKEIVEDDDLPF